MNKRILNTGVQDYIRNYSSSDILSVSFKKQLFDGVTNQELLQQLEGRKKSKVKLPLWYSTPLIYYPRREAIEQSSSETTARYKSALVQGTSLLDITGGLGVDSYFLSKSFSNLTYCERQEELAEITAHNFDVLGADNIEVRTEDGLDYLRSTEKDFDVVFLDPARRTATGTRIFTLKEAEPPLPESLALIWKRTNTVLIKTSPLLDMASGLKDLGPVMEVHIVAVDNEVKELLWLLEKGHKEEPLITSVNLGSKGQQKFSFYLSEEKKTKSSYHSPLKYIYEPNASLLKAGAFKITAARYGLSKLHMHSHLYTSGSLCEFPGKKYEVIQYERYNPKRIKELDLDRAHIISRNFPDSAEKLRKRFRIKEGDQRSLIFTKGPDGELIYILCRKISDNND